MRVATTPGRRLDSWKEIAAYVNRDVSTVRRWEKRERLPIHRQAHASRDSVFAFTEEIDSWVESRQRLTPSLAPPTETVESGRSGRHVPLAAAVALAIAIGFMLAASAGSAIPDRSFRQLLTASSAGPGTVSQSALRFYLRGRQRMESRNPQGFASALTDFREAITRDPGFAKAYAGLADAHSLMGYYRFQPPREAFEAARAAALMALKLDDSLAEAHASLAGLMASYDWDWSGAEREYRRAIELDPSFAAARHGYANCLSLMGRHDEAIAQAREAAGLQPLSLIILTGALGNAYTQAGQYEQAASQYRSAIELDNNFGNAHASLGLLYWRQGRLTEARQELQVAASLVDNPSWVARLAALQASMGEPEEARRLRDTFERQPDRVSPSALALIYLHLGDREQAIMILERASDARDPDLPSVKTEPGLEEIRNEPRVAALLRRMRLT